MNGAEEPEDNFLTDNDMRLLFLNPYYYLNASFAYLEIKPVPSQILRLIVDGLLFIYCFLMKDL